MLIKISNLQKHHGAKELINHPEFSIYPGEKLAIIGRNGYGKSTLLRILAGLDTDFSGDVESRKNLSIIMTQQEHITNDHQTALNYVLENIPNYIHYQQVIQDYENGFNPDIQEYSDAVEYYSDHGYYFVKDLILETFKSLQLSDHQINLPLQNLSGGEKRYVELVRVMYSQADLLLIDEPTNHMDYIGKERFINWLNSVENSVVIVTHDRDLLKHVHKIVELKDKKLNTYNGNYDHYLKQNTTATTNSVIQYQNQLKKIEEAKKRVDWGLKMRSKSKDWKIRYDHWLRDYQKLKDQTIKPSFWIDQNSTENLDKEIINSYHKFKEKNVKIKIDNQKEKISELLSIRNLSLGYKTPLFTNLNFNVRAGDKIFIKGRNGAGKSTLVKTIISLSNDKPPQANIFDGEIKKGVILRIGEYQQEISPQYLNLSLGQAIKQAYENIGQNIEEANIKRLLAQYLFDPSLEFNQNIASLSGGQKARFQIIKMLANEPNLLILDEPTNHLDLPSIEELENALSNFNGGIIYISHDNYFINNLGGQTISL